jgi:predicted transcriptional regulator
MENTRPLEDEITEILMTNGPLSVAFITRFLNERGIDCTRQRVERTLRKMMEKRRVIAFYRNGNQRKHYRLR